MSNLAIKIDLFDMVYEQKLRRMTNQELDKEFSRAVFSNAQDPLYAYRCMAIEREYMRRGLPI